MLAKSVHDAAWNILIQHVSYKAAWAGGVVALVDPRGTSQTCPECGTTAPERLSNRTHRCNCGCVLDRDVAAAQRAGCGLEQIAGRLGQAARVKMLVKQKATAFCVSAGPQNAVENGLLGAFSKRPQETFGPAARRFRNIFETAWIKRSYN